MKLASNSGCAVIQLELDGAMRLSPALVGAVNRACDQAEDAGQPAVLSVLLRAEDGAHAPAAAPDMALVSQWERALNRIEKLRVPTLAVVEGRCAGLLLEVLLSTDYRIGAPQAQLSLAHLGAIWPGMALHRLATQLGVARARGLALFGDVLEANAAQALGLLDQVHADPVHWANHFVETLSAAAIQDIAVRRRLLIEAGATSYEDALGAHLAACDRSLRRQPAPAPRAEESQLQRA